MRILPLLVVLVVGCSGTDPGEALAPEDVGAESAGEDAAASSDTGDGDGATPDTASGTADGATPDTNLTDAGSDTGTPPDATPSGGCGKPATPGVTNAKITVGGVERTYVLSIPTGYDPSKPLPLVFAWHGRTGSGASFRGYAGVEKAAGGKAIFVYPDGLPVTDDPKDTGWVLGASGRDVALFDALVKEMEGRLCVDDARVFSFGYSFGGYMSNALGCHRSAVLRAIAPYAGGGPSGTCGAAVAAWIGHATNDPTVKIAEGQKSRDVWTKKNGCGTTTKDVSPSPCVEYEGCSEPVRWCNTATGGHGYPTWAGGAIWGFFAGL